VAIKLTKIDIGKRLLAIRGQKTREEVADAVGISVSALQMYENGQRMPRDDIKIRIASYFGISVQFLFFDIRTHETWCRDFLSEKQQEPKEVNNRECGLRAAGNGVTWVDSEFTPEEGAAAAIR